MARHKLHGGAPGHAFHTHMYNTFHAGTLYVQMGRLDDGERNLLHALKLNPSHHGAKNNLRVVEHQRKGQNKPS